LSEFIIGFLIVQYVVADVVSFGVVFSWGPFDRVVIEQDLAAAVFDPLVDSGGDAFEWGCDVGVAVSGVSA
jgi:hypothetical protein